MFSRLFTDITPRKVINTKPALTSQQAYAIIENLEPLRLDSSDKVPVVNGYYSISAPKLEEIGITVDQLRTLPSTVYDGTETVRDYSASREEDENPQQVHVFIKPALEAWAALHRTTTSSSELNGHGHNGHKKGGNGRY